MGGLNTRGPEAPGFQANNMPKEPEKKKFSFVSRSGTVESFDTEEERQGAIESEQENAN